jgi:anti-anti-sigma factor
MKKLKIKTVQLGEDAVYLMPSGDLVLGSDNTGKMADILKALVAQEYGSVYIDMSKVGRIDAAGIGVLVAAYAEGQARQTRVELRHLTERARDLLTIVKLFSVFAPLPVRRRAA